MATQKVNFPSKVTLPLAPCDEVTVCLDRTWEDKTLDGSKLITATIDNNHRNLGPRHYGRGMDPRGAEQIQYSLLVDDSQFEIEIATGLPYVLTCADIVEINPYSCSAQALKDGPDVDVERVDTVAAFTLGTVIQEDGNEYRYLGTGAGSAAQYGAVLIAPGYAAIADCITGNVGTNLFEVAVPQIALGTSEFGWGLISGNGIVSVAANCANNTILNVTAVAGVLDDDGGAADVAGVKIIATNGGSQADVAFNASSRMSVNAV